MPVLSLACHLPHNTPHIPSRYNNEQTTKQTKAINNSYIYINISCKCDTNRAGHFTLDAYASRPVACSLCIADIFTGFLICCVCGYRLTPNYVTSPFQDNINGNGTMPLKTTRMNTDKKITCPPQVLTPNYVTSPFQDNINGNGTMPLKTTRMNTDKKITCPPQVLGYELNKTKAKQNHILWDVLCPRSHGNWNITFLLHLYWM